MSGPASRRQHVRFCQVEGWQEVRNARGKPVRHHLTYELGTPSGDILRTRISRPANAETYGPRLWSAISTEQLHVTEDEFWECVNNSVRPAREATTQARDTALPAALAYQLVHTLGLSEHQVAALSRDDAIGLMQAHWSKPS